MKNSMSILIAFALVAIAVLPDAVSQSKTHQLKYRVSNPTPTVLPLAGQQVRLGGSGAMSSGAPGQPALPAKVVRLALPPDAESSTISIRIRPLEIKTLSGKYDVAPMPPKVPIHGGAVYWGPHAARIQNHRDVLVYGQDALFPRSWGEVEPFEGQLRRLRYRTVRVYPTRFNPAQKILLHAGAFEIELSYKKITPGREVPLPDCVGQSLARELFYNYDQVKSWYEASCSPQLGALYTETPKNVAIIMTKALKQPSAMLDDYILMREKQGYQIDIFTEDDWDNSTGIMGMDSRADRIRAWLQNNYQEKDLGYAFLLGNPNPASDLKYGIPMKECGTHEDSDMGKIVGPTDFYYADLSGTWDDNNNGIVCEYGLDNVDFTPEIYVGRIPIYSDGAQALDEILTRIIDYEQESQEGDLEWRRRMLLPNSIYFFEAQVGTQGARWDGASTGEYFVREQLSPRGLEWTTLYEVDGLKPSIFESHFPINARTLVDQWVRGYGLVFWAGHGSNTGVYRTVWEDDPNEDGVVDYREMSSPEFMSTEMLHMLQQSPPPFVIHGSCSNGTPEDANNLGYSMLRRGAIATLSASRLALAWHYPDFGTEYWDKIDSWDGCVLDIVTDYAVNIMNGMEAGRALGTTIAKTTDLSESVSWFQKSIQNLYGDPLMRLTMCRKDADCSNGITCDGKEVCANGACLPGEPLVCSPEDHCDQMVCVEGEGCVPDTTCLETDLDAGGGDAAPEDLLDSDSDPLETGTAGDGPLAGVSGCTTLCARSPRPSIIAMILKNLFR